ncbi:hypothetical protein ACO0RG_002744 [Hanseniaspora osmophila]|uniref:Protein MUK1 n=1 Tax=Hanseniaspora osmophila TaxID=56408 RepID=A0A1E5R809_9ASCO|nr:Protein MUK1 [Hanseniaspora osmophila]
MTETPTNNENLNDPSAELATKMAISTSTSSTMKTSSIRLPEALNILVRYFITDLKEPKYTKPLTICQLAFLFQKFYCDFEKAIDSFQQQLRAGIPTLNTQKQHARSSSLTNIGSGLSGFFTRSRSSSNASTNHPNAPNSNVNSTSLASATTRVPLSTSASSTSELATTSLQNQNKKNGIPYDTEIDDEKLKSEYMKILERQLFERISSSGTNVPDSKVIEKFRFENLFKNNQEYLDFNTLFNSKLKNLNSLKETVDWKQFLSVDNIPDLDKLIMDLKVKELFLDFTRNSLSPIDKMETLLLLQNTIIDHLPTSGNDDLLSVLIYCTIEFSVEQLFLTYKFIKLFRCRESLKGQELFAITNIEAVIAFIGDLVDVPGMELYNIKISEQISIPENDEDDLLKNGSSLEDQELQFESKDSVDGSIPNKFSQQQQQQQQQPTLRNALNVNKSFSSLSSIKSVLGKLYYPPGASPVANTPTEPLFSSSPVASPVPVNSEIDRNVMDDDMQTSTLSSSTSKTISVDTDLCQELNCYRGKQFEDLTINELKMMFNTYQKISDQL